MKAFDAAHGLATGGVAAALAAPVAGVGEAASIGFGILGDILAFCAEPSEPEQK